MNKKISNHFGKWGWGTIFYCMVAYYIADLIGNCGLNIYTGLFPVLRGWSADAILSLFSVATWIAVVGVIVFSQVGQKVGSRTIALVGYIVLSVMMIAVAVGTIIITLMNMTQNKEMVVM